MLFLYQRRIDMYGSIRSILPCDESQRSLTALVDLRRRGMGRTMVSTSMMGYITGRFKDTQTLYGGYAVDLRSGLLASLLASAMIPDSLRIIVSACFLLCLISPPSELLTQRCNGFWSI